MIFISETNFFPNILWHCLAIHNEFTIIEQHENYQKHSFRNKCEITSSQGRISLTVPIVGGRDTKKIITAVEIDYSQNWMATHLKTLKSAYGNSPFFEHYYFQLENLYSKKPKTLWELNLETIKWSNKALRNVFEFGFTEEFNLNYSDDYFDKRYQKQNANSIPLLEFKYSQVFDIQQDFISNLSILDLLFNHGPESILILRKMISNL